MDYLPSPTPYLQPFRALVLFCRSGFFFLKNRRETCYQTAPLAEQHRVLDVRNGVLELQLAKMIFLLVDSGANLFDTQFPDFFRLQHVGLDLIPSIDYRLPAASGAR